MEFSAMMDASRFPGKNGGEQIQAALDTLGEQPKVIHIGPQGPDGNGLWLLTRAITIPSNTTLVFNSARLYLADHTNDNLLRNLHADSGDDRRDENIHLLGWGAAELNGNAANQSRQAQMYRTFGISFHKVDRCSIKGLALGPTEAWGMGLENMNDLFVDSIRLQQDGKTHNQDGVHVSGPGSRVCISNLLGTVADDAVALDPSACFEDYRGSARGAGGLLENIVVSNVSVKNLKAGAVVRTLAAKGKGLDGVFISQVVITGSNQVLKIGWDRWGARQGGRELGDIFPSGDEHKNIVIDGVKGSTPDVFCRIESNVKNLTIKNVRGTCGTAALSNLCADGYAFSLENVLLDDWIIEGCQTAVEIGGGVKCQNLTVRNSVFSSAASAAPGAGSACARFSGAGQRLVLKRVRFENVVFTGFAKGVLLDQDALIEDDLRLVDVDMGEAENEPGAQASKLRIL